MSVPARVLDLIRLHNAAWEGPVLGAEPVDVAYDPRRFELAAQQLLVEGLPMTEFPQSVERMVPACGHAYEAIVSGRMVHDGNPVLANHVLSAARRESERGWTLSKGKSRRHIDACIAMCIALWKSAQPPPPEPPKPFVFWV